MWEDFIDTETIGAFSADTLKTTHPIAVKVNTPNEVEEIFDEISYGKGGSILRMIESYLGEEEFRKGVSNYLKKYQYKNAKAEDLWNSLSKTSSKPIKKIMESWINQPGYPIIELNEKKNKLLLKQRRFNSHKPQTWLIPLILRDNKKILKKVISKREEKIKIKSTWLKANYEQEGFYRVKYSKNNLKKLELLVLSKKISVLDRWGIQNDLFNLALIGEISLDNYLEFVKSYEKENSYFVLSDIYANLYQLYYLFQNTQTWKTVWPKFKSHISKPFENNFKRLKWEPKKKENINDSLLRPLTISFLSFVEDKKIIEEGMKKLNANLHPDIQGAVYSLIAQNGDFNLYKKLLKKYEKIKNIEEKVKLLSTLYKFKDKKALEASLKYALSLKIKTQDLRTVFAIISSNPHYKNLFLNWVKSNWKKLKDFEKTHFVFMGFLETLITSHTDKSKLEEIKKFLDKHKVKYEKTKANSFEIADINFNFIRKNSKILEKYFQ